MSKAAKPKVVLASMPWTAVAEPSLGLALLKAQLARDGIASKVLHLNLLLLRYMTGATYQQIASCWGLNEFVFTGLLDDALSPDQADCLLERCHANNNPNYPHPYPDPVDFGNLLIRLRHEIIPDYVDVCAREIVSHEPTMVGFTCLFDQTLASAAVARRVRELLPEALIVFGGYALEGPPGLEVLQAFPWIDAIAGGDGEPVISRLARASVGEDELESIPGLMTRARPEERPRIPYALDLSPDPDYSDWFEDLAQLKARDRVTVRTTVLPVESSRGCWWGQKHHCVFCGIDENTLSYRRKRPETVLRLLAGMRERYGEGTAYRFSDYILPHDYLTTLLPRLAEVEPRYEMHCEIKANQNEERLAAFADAGFSELQPGIELFDSDVLRLMKKGVRGIHNVQTLKLGYEHGILINYNILYGIPGEQRGSYVRMAEQLPRLYHLTPPVTRTEAIVTRFAPMQADPAAFSPVGAAVTTPRHHRCYDALFSRDFFTRTGFSLDNYAYYFERYLEYEPETSALYWLIIREVDHWKAQHLSRDVYLSWEAEGERLSIEDTRFGSTARTSLTGLARQIYLHCDHSPATLAEIGEALGISDRERDAALDDLDEARLVWREEDRVLGLATPLAVVEGHMSRRWQATWTSVYC